MYSKFDLFAKIIDSLEELWNIFGFETHVHENLTASELVEQLSNYAKMNHNNYDIFVGCFLSHGDSGKSS